MRSERERILAKQARRAREAGVRLPGQGSLTQEDLDLAAKIKRREDWDRDVAAAIARGKIERERGQKNLEDMCQRVAEERGGWQIVSD